MEVIKWEILRDSKQLNSYVKKHITDESMWYVFLDEVRVCPLSFSEYVSAYSGDKYDAWLDYYIYGGLPLILSRQTEELEAKYLNDLCSELYLKDIEERNKLRGDNAMADLVNVLASAVRY